MGITGQKHINAMKWIKSEESENLRKQANILKLAS